MRKTKSAILEAVHETAKGLHAAGVMEQVTLREFDRLCLPPVEPLSPSKIRKIRVQSRVSQAVFAALLNTSVSTVQKWEIGQKRPTGRTLAACPASRASTSRAPSCTLCNAATTAHGCSPAPRTIGSISTACVTPRARAAWRSMPTC
jgi:putative transcriptional regulator